MACSNAIDRETGQCMPLRVEPKASRGAAAAAGSWELVKHSGRCVTAARRTCKLRSDSDLVPKTHDVDGRGQGTMVSQPPSLQLALVACSHSPAPYLDIKATDRRHTRHYMLHMLLATQNL